LAPDPTAQTRYANRILATLPQDSIEGIADSLQKMDLVQGTVLAGAGIPWRRAYFPERGMVSLVKTMEDGRSIEVGAVGVNGMIGLLGPVGPDLDAIQVIVQVPGFAWSIEDSALSNGMARDDRLCAVLRQYAQQAVAKLLQLAACNGLHSVRERCCRWLLTAHDAAGSDSFPLTHEMLATMLGVQRAAVSVVATSLRAAGLISYRHGRVTIGDRQGLERETCECYRALCAAFHPTTR
jgi:CRP-like cAMP-binding protein